MAVLPRKVGNPKSKERFISRFLSNRLIDPCSIMAGFIPEIIKMMTDQDKTMILMVDQSKISDGFECLMVSLRVAGRAIPVAWKVVETIKDPLVLMYKPPLLNAVLNMIPQGAAIFLAGDRFYGTSALIAWCQKNNWQYRLRLKSNLILTHEGGRNHHGRGRRKGVYFP